MKRLLFYVFFCMVVLISTIYVAVSMVNFRALGIKDWQICIAIIPILFLWISLSHVDRYLSRK